MTALLEALGYRERGLSVIPLAPRSKRPHSGVLEAVHGDPGWNRFKFDPASERDIRGWFRREPRLNVAVVTGAVSGGLVTIDLDRPVDGLRHPPTPSVRTSRGRHIWAKATSAPAASRHDWGEIRAGGQYVVAPPSVHEDGTRYEWELGLDDVELADFSEVVLPESASEGRGGTEAGHALPEYPSDETPERWMLAHDESAVIEAMRVIGISSDIGTSFGCVLPGHEEQRASASVYLSESGAYRYYDWHRRSGQPSFSLAHVLVAQRAGEVIDVPGPSLARWNLRLFYEARCLDAVPVEMPSVPSGMPAALHTVARGFQLLCGLRWLRDPVGSPVPFGWDFAKLWCEPNAPGRRQTGEAILELRRRGIIKSDDEWSDRRGLRRGNLFVPGDGRPWRPGR
jgi:hypothetical protein